MEELKLGIQKAINEVYWSPLRQYLNENKNLVKTFPAFLLGHEKLVFYHGKTHLAIEYFGNELTDKLSQPKNTNIEYHDYTSSGNLLEEIVGFKFVSSILQLPKFSDDFVLTTTQGMEKLLDVKWDFDAQKLTACNLLCFYVPEGQFCRLVNARFFDADESGLKTRYIKWIDFLPITTINLSDDETKFQVSLSELSEQITFDAHYSFPLPPKADYRLSKLPQVNRFLELINDIKTTEPQLTGFLGQSINHFILKMAFFAQEVHSEVLCKWQSDTKQPIKPDFLIVGANGFADIVEFKLPNLKGKTIVGEDNRSAFSAEINSYIAQTRVYKEYFEDPNNREWVKKEYNIDVKYPKRILVMGRRDDFSNKDWKSIKEDYRDIDIMTFDELTDGIVALIYT